MKFKRGTLIASCLFATFQVWATAYVVPPKTQSIIGKNVELTAESGDSVVTVATKYDLGYNALQSANPDVDMRRAFVSGQQIKVPTKHLLPDLPRKGIVINLPEMRMYYYLEDSNKVLTYPIGIGKIGKTIPTAMTAITRKTKNPIWIPPDDIREFNLEQGVVLPKVMPPGPDNPLGPYAIYMQIPTYLIHSTIFPESVGKRASFGCIRMYESDIKTFFPSIEGGIPVAIINEPVKAGWQNDRLFLEASEPLEEHGETYSTTVADMTKLVTEKTKNKVILVDWQMLSFLADAQDSIPHEVAMHLPR